MKTTKTKTFVKRFWLSATIALSMAWGAEAGGLPFSTGDVFVGCSDSGRTGTIAVFNQCGSWIETINTGLNATTHAGMAFDAMGNLYVTGYDDDTVVKISSQDSSVTTFCTDDGGSHNESILFDNVGNAYIGQADGTQQIIKRNSSGGFLQRYTVATESRGSDWIALASDQKTMLYTSEGTNILRYDVSTSTQLANFNQALLGPYGSSAFALVILGDGSVLVADQKGTACTSSIMKLKSDGSAGTPANIGQCDGMGGWYALALDPDGTSFWATDAQGSSVYRYNFSTGVQMINFNVQTVLGTSPQGIAVYGTNPKNSTLLVWWDTVLGKIQTAPCTTTVYRSPYEANTYYIGGIYGKAMGLKPDHSPNPLNQPAVTALSIVRAVVDQYTHVVTCQALTDNSQGTPGVYGSNQVVMAIAQTETLDVYVGGNFYQVGANSYNEDIGCYRAGGAGWDTAIFSVGPQYPNVVNGLSYNHYNKKLTVSGTFTWVSGWLYNYCAQGTSSLTVPGTVYWQTYNGNFDCGYFTP